jgi:CRP-like cAMP-binding protein
MKSRQFLHSLFKKDGLSPTELQILVPSFRAVQLEKGDYLLKEGEYAKAYYFVEQGFLRSFAIDTAGNEVTTNFYAAGQMVLDAASFLLQQPTREFIQASESSLCWALDFGRFQELFDSIDTFRNSGRSRLVQDLLALKQRSIAMITDSAKDRYLGLLANQPDILQQAQLKHIASYLGVTDTSLSRVRREISKGQG